MKNKFQSLFFITFISCGGFSLFGSNIIMKLFPNSGYLVLLLMLPFTILIAFLLSKKRILIKDIIRSPFLRILLLIYLIASGFFTFYSFLSVINDFYYPLTSRIVIFLILLLVCHFLATYGINNIVKVGFVVVILTILIYSLTIFSDTKYDFTLLKYNNFAIGEPLFLFSFLFIFLDGFLLIIFLPSKQPNFKKCFLYVLFVTLITSFFILENYLFYPSSYFIQHNYPYLLKYFTYKNKTFLEHLDISYLVCITIFTIFHYSIQIEIFRILLKKTRKSKMPLLISAIIFLIFVFTDHLYIKTTWIGYFMLCLSGLLLLFFVIILLKRKRLKC